VASICASAPFLRHDKYPQLTCVKCTSRDKCDFVGKEAQHFIVMYVSGELKS
jgi:hypothetical protein